LDVRDVVRAYWVIVEEGRPGVVYNVCSGRSVAIEEVLDTLVGMSHARISVSVDPARLRPVDVPDFVGDNSRLVRETSWRQRIALADSLRDVLEFWRGKIA
jgi:GDP-4-dehydro-6-deoxy-D-mannose reductase